MALSNLARLIVSVAICYLAAAIGAMFTFRSVTTWYAALARPGFAPPNWVFGPVWTLLYFLMGVSLYLVWSRGTGVPYVRIALIVFFVQLVLNALWSILFFGLHSPLAGLVGIALLWLALVLTIFYFWKISPLAGGLLVPYLLWVSFAGMLNFAIWRLNL